MSGIAEILLSIRPGSISGSDLRRSHTRAHPRAAQRIVEVMEQAAAGAGPSA